MSPPFVPLESFLDPAQTSDGKPYGPQRFKDIIKERYYISKYCNTSYLDVGKITPVERSYLLEFIMDELQKQKEAIEKQKAELGK